MKVIPLGTVSGKPTLSRNVSATALVREGEWLLFDCGEGTQMQVMRAGLQPSRLVAIFITHLHGDHFNGLAGFLSTMGLDRRERSLSIIGPPGIREYLETLNRLKILFINYGLSLCELSPREFAGPESSDAAARTVYQGEDYRVTCLPLSHRVFAIGYRVEENPRPGRFDVDRAQRLGVPAGPLFGRLQSGHNVELPDGRVVEPSEVLGPPRQGKRVAYCTDTRPCRSAVKLGRDVDLLIHEATFAEDLADQAAEYGHSTAAQAANTARESGARRLLITHFSTRYPDPRPLFEEARALFPETMMAEELVAIEL